MNQAEIKAYVEKFGRKPIILCDQDNVLFSTIIEMIKDIYEKFGIYIKNEEVTDYDIWDKLGVTNQQLYSLFTSDFFEKLPPIEEAISVTRRLISKYDFKVVTATYKNKRVEGKIKSLNKYFPHIKEIIFECEKYKIEGDILIDDRTRNCVDFIENTGKSAIVFDKNGEYHFNKNFDETLPNSFRAINWEEIEIIIDNHFLSLI